MRFYACKVEQSNGDHEVHTTTCIFLPIKENRISLGEFFDCSDAIEKAKDYYEQVNGCFFCSRLCHEK
tara:strand:- start:20393 stop:20596 length:204 start_codon:yes stop_codon:yes gene_type:complete